MTRVLELVEAFLSKKKVDFEEHEDVFVIRPTLGVKYGMYPILVYTDEQARTLLAEAVCPLTAPKIKMGVVADLITRLNFRLRMGKLTLDREDGELAFRTATLVGQAGLDDESLKLLIFGSAAILHRFLPAVSLVLLTDMSPQKAIEQLDNKDDHPDEDNHRGNNGHGRSSRFSGPAGFFSMN